MNFDKVNKGFTFLANMTVIVGLILLVIELRQANKMALRESYAELSNMGMQTNALVINNLEFASLKAKLRSKKPQLSAIEKELADAWLFTQFNWWSSIQNSYELGLIDEMRYERYLITAARITTTYPGFYELYLDVLADWSKKDSVDMGSWTFHQKLIKRMSLIE